MLSCLFARPSYWFRYDPSKNANHKQRVTGLSCLCVAFPTQRNALKLN